jgi:hypothetical protein
MNLLDVSIAGWTMSRIIREPSGEIMFHGGPLHRLMTAVHVFDAANDGEVWCIYTSYEGDNATFVYGGCTDAHRTCDPVAQRFLAGEIFDASPHCPCD